jgi:hypothetical protein
VDTNTVQHVYQVLDLFADKEDESNLTAVTAGCWDAVGVKNDAAVAQGHWEYFVPRVDPDASSASVGSL